MTRQEKIFQEIQRRLDEGDSFDADEFIRGVEWADKNPSEAHIAKYLGEKGWPLSSQGVITYEGAVKLCQTAVYYESKQKWIDEACKFIKDYAPIDYNCDYFVEYFRRVMEEKL